MCSLADLDRPAVAVGRPIDEVHLGQLVGSGPGGSTSGSSSGRAPSSGELVEAGDGLVVDAGRGRSAVASAGIHALAISVTRWRKWSKAASSPMTDSTASGQALVVGGHVGQVLDLADDVVAEVADEPAVQRRQVGEARRPVAGQERLDRGEHALVERDRVGHGAVDGDVEAAGREGRGGPAADERPAAPALAVLDRLEQEAGLVVPAEAGEGGDRRDQVGQQLAPHRDDGVLRGEGVEPGADQGWARRRISSIRLGPEGPEEAGVLAGVAGALALLLDDEQQRVAVAVVAALADELAVAGRLALAPLLLAGPAPEPRAARLEGLPQRLVVHPRHHQHLAGALLLHDGGHQAVGVEGDRASCSSVSAMGVVTGMAGPS